MNRMPEHRQFTARTMREAYLARAEELRTNGEEHVARELQESVEVFERRYLKILVAEQFRAMPRAERSRFKTVDEIYEGMILSDGNAEVLLDRIELLVLQARRLVRQEVLRQMLGADVESDQSRGV